MIDPKIIFGRLGNSLFQYAYIYAQCRRGEIPDIYIQDPKYFDEFRDEIRQLFGEGIRPSDFVAIHLRRGGNPLNPNEPRYSENPFYVNLAQTDYYRRAVEHFPNERFLVFSDDVAFAREYFNGDQFIFDHSKDAVAVLNRMAGCKGIIMANSSLSFWAAYLGSPNKRVIAPSIKNWYSDGVERTKCPQNWERI